MNEPHGDARLEAARRAFDLDELSPAERRVLALALEGRSVKEMTDALVLGEATVRSHLSRIYGKLGVRGRVELLARVAESGGGRATVEATPVEPSVAPPPEALAPILVALLAIVGASVLLPFMAVITAPALLIAGVLSLAGRPGSRRRRAAPWMFVAALLTAAWLAVVVLGFIAVSSPSPSSSSPGLSNAAGAMERPVRSLRPSKGG